MKISDNGFHDGFLIYDVKNLQSPDEVAQWLGDTKLNSWGDGFLGFSKGETRISGVGDKDITVFLANMVSGIEGADGYLMEAGLWRCKIGEWYEEVSIEREDRGFFCQRWILYTDTGRKAVNENTKYYECYYQEAKTQRIIRGRDKELFKGELSSIEVIVPDKRLNIFITVPGGNNG